MGILIFVRVYDLIWSLINWDVKFGTCVNNLVVGRVIGFVGEW